MRLLLFWAQLRRLARENARLQQQLARSEAKYESECARNRERENFLISQVLTAAGRYGLPKSVDPPKVEAPRPMRRPELTGIQKATIAAIRAEGEARGESESEILEKIEAIKTGEVMPRFDDMIN